MKTFSATVESLRAETASLMRRLISSIRRVGIDLSDGVSWRAKGHDALAEVFRAEVFQHVGFWSRPKSGANVDAVIVNAGGAGNPCLVGSRDVGVQQDVAPLAEDEAAMFNSLGGVFVKADGTIEARSKLGVAVPLATKADLDALASYVKKHIHGGVAAGATSTQPPVAGLIDGTGVPSAAGTTKLKGE